MSISTALSSLFTKAPEAETEISHNWVTSSRFIVLIVFAGLLIWLTKGVLTEHNISLIFWLAMTYVVVNSATKAIQMILTYKLKSQAMEYAWHDGVLTEVEAEVVKSA